MRTLYLDIETLPMRSDGSLSEALSPDTATIFTLTVYDPQLKQGTVYMSLETSELTIENWGVKTRSETGMLVEFWRGVQHYERLIGFGIEEFDLTFIKMRSKLHDIKTGHFPKVQDLQAFLAPTEHTTQKMSFKEMLHAYTVTREEFILAYSEVHSLIVSEQGDALVAHCINKLMAITALADAAGID
jgi:hypothetical protein